ncbi:PadR family transcriptional regulator [Ktedonosporobacter rubrisoli]|uniref:PadR family transcriptional regulator n=1 Tax=Ktedonosporobacter rubrisoli TaxID=2509675 RepID=A0A4P6JHS3_KTERU|nr:PadR family transcriptional regulator [Ktedonosporobacter rubrisoli]QBD74493.1 PadR family transcriptional regulator [Ktedonosporobacter rubrisoli]
MKAERRTQWLRGVLDLCILGVLYDGEYYGYAISQRLEQAGLGHIKGGTLYPLLARLEEMSLVTSRWTVRQQGPGRKYYVLTEQGRRVFEEQASDWTMFAEHVATLIYRRGE